MATLRDYYNIGDNSSSIFGELAGTWKAGQSFTASVSYDIVSVKLKLYRVGTPGTITIELYAEDGSDFPTGIALTSGTTNGNTLTTNSAGEWREITFGSPYSLVSGTKYVIVASASGWGVYWRSDTADATYAGGKAIYYNRVSWSELGSGGTDFMFENWDNYTFLPPVPTPTNTLNIIKRLVAAASNKIWYENI